MNTREQIVNRQILRWLKEQTDLAAQRTAEESAALLRPVVTVSRQIGSGGAWIATMLARHLGYELFDREMIHAVAAQAGVQDEMVRALEERRGSGVDRWVEGVIRGRQFDDSDYLRALVKTVYLLARHGAAVIVGRGANFILESEPAFHVRIVAPVAVRRSWLERTQGLSPQAAETLLRERDRLQAEFTRKLFRRSIEDPMAYHLVLNTGRVPAEAGVDTIIDALAHAGWEIPQAPAARKAG